MKNQTRTLDLWQKLPKCLGLLLGLPEASEAGGGSGAASASVTSEHAKHDGFSGFTHIS